MPRGPCDRSVTAIATIVPPMRPWVMNCLLPLITHAPPSRTARVRMAAASLPELASVKPQAPRCCPVASGRRNSLLLRVVAEHAEMRDTQAVVRGHRQANGRIHAREFLDAQAVGDGGHARPAPRLRHLNPHEPQGRQLGQQVHRERLGLVPGHDVRPDLGLGELADRQAQELLFFGQLEVHPRENTIFARAKPTPGVGFRRFRSETDSRGRFRPDWPTAGIAPIMTA